MSHWLIVAMALAVTTADARQSVPTAGIAIEGRVVDAVTRQPLRGAIVRANLSRGAISVAPPEAAFLTGHDGRFQFRALAAGTIGLYVTKTGYLSGDGDQLALAPGDLKKDIVIALVPEALISGRVVDEYGEPLENITVRALLKGDAAKLDRGESATTDDAGNYLIGGLEAGEYIVGIPEGSTGDKGVNRAGGAPGMGLSAAHASAFFSGVSTLQDAAPVRAAAGEERSGVDLMLRTDFRIFTLEGNLVSGEMTAGTIGGIVRDPAGRGLSRAMVVLVPSEEMVATGKIEPRAVAADESGRFEFAKVPPGRFRVRAARLGFSPPEAAAPGVFIELGAAQIRNDLVLTLSKAGVISGTLRDQFGDPIAGSVEVRPVGAGPAGRSRQTNARGQYRISGIQPGEYLALAVQNPLGRDMHMLDESGQERRVAFRAVYYPGVGVGSLASPITIERDREIAGLDFVVRPAPVTTIAVTIDGGGHTISNARVQQIPLDEGSRGARTIARRDDLQIRLDSVGAGRHVLVGSGDELHQDGTLARRLWAQTEVMSDGVVPLEVSLFLEAGAQFSGRVIFEGTSARPAAIQGRLRALPPMIGASEVVWLTSSRDGVQRFMIDDIRPGRYIIEAGERDNHIWTFKAATAGGRDVFDLPVDLAAGSEMADIVLTFTDRTTEVSGTVTDAAGRALPDTMVIAFPAENRYWFATRRIQGAVSDDQGRYVLRGLPPGGYRVATGKAFTNLTPDWIALLPKLVPSSVLITLSEGERKIQDLRRLN